MGLTQKILNHSLYLNEIRTNPPGADLERVATPKGCVPGTARIQNLTANLERSPLTHSLSYGSAGDRPTLFVRRIPAPHPFGAYAKNRSRRFFARFLLTKSPGAILNARQCGPQGGGHDCRDAGGRAMHGAIAEDARSNFVPFMQHAG